MKVGTAFWLGVAMMIGSCSYHIAKADPYRAPRVECDQRYLWTCDTRGWTSRGFEVKSGRAPRHQYRGPSTSGLVAPLAAKTAEIVAACGSRVVSAVRHTYVAGTRRLSLHASGRAVDLVGNPGCIYSMLRGWPGGYTTDYGRVRHVHVSWGGGEHVLRFAHRHTKKSKRSGRPRSRK